MTIAPFTQDLNIVVGDSFQAILTCFASDLSQLDLSAATSATLNLYITPEDIAPLVTVTTTSGPSGQLIFGIAPPVPIGRFVTGQAALAGIGTAAFMQLGITATIVAIAATIVALKALSTTNYVLSNVVFVSGTGQYFQWSPLDSRTPNDTTIVQGAGSTGNWLLAGSVTIVLAAAATAALVGYDRAVMDLEVTWSDGTVQLISGTAFLGQPAP